MLLETQACTIKLMAESRFSQLEMERIGKEPVGNELMGLGVWAAELDALTPDSPLAEGAAQFFFVHVEFLGDMERRLMAVGGTAMVLEAVIVLEIPSELLRSAE